MEQVVEIIPCGIQGPVKHSQYHGCWWPDDARSQGISSHDIDQIFQNIPLSVPERLPHIYSHNLVLRYDIHKALCFSHMNYRIEANTIYGDNLGAVSI